jgi:hypothetical protein
LAPYLNRKNRRLQNDTGTLVLDNYNGSLHGVVFNDNGLRRNQRRLRYQAHACSSGKKGNIKISENGNEIIIFKPFTLFSNLSGS